MKVIIRKVFVGLLIVATSFSFTSCNEETLGIIEDILSLVISQTGWLAEDENLNDIPEDITPYDDDTSNMKAQVSLEDKFPPIGDQGQYGTCVAWAVGYNLKTALNAIEKGWTTTQLSNSANQTSPKDLWFAIPSASKGSRCEGTNFEPAMDALITKGAASLNTVPYSSLGTCAGTATGDSGNKLANYRKIAYKDGSKSSGMTVDNFKGYLHAGRPIAFGAQLGERFMAWDNATVIDYDTDTYKGQHAYHAMVLVGYDDSKSAFRVRNSWGTGWGDKGSIWVDYDFFLSGFCFAAFVGQNVSSVSVGNGQVNPGDLSKGTDLMAHSAYDVKDPEGTSNRQRAFSYEIFNSGTTTILASSRWSAVYMYYNASNANDYQIIFEDYYTDQFGQGDGPYDDTSALTGGWWNNAKVEPGVQVGYEEYEEDGFVITYTMPEITGKYYLVVMADAFDVLPEVNEDNNFYFITAANGKPLEFEKGVMKSTPQYQAKSGGRQQVKQFGNLDTQSVTTLGSPNAYTPEELKMLLNRDKKSGRLEEKITRFRAHGGNEQVKAIKKAQ